MTCGWQLVIRAEWCDATPGKPHGVDYAFNLMDENGQRILGFDNSHAYDRAPPGAPFDHEHRAGYPGRNFPYEFSDAWTLLADFFQRVDALCTQRGIPFEFKDTP